MQKAEIIVMKFGGSSVGTAAALRQVTGLVQETRSGGKRQPIVVVSALEGVTDLLLEGARAAAAGNARLVLELGEQIRAKHRAAMAGQDEVAQGRVQAAVERILGDYLREAQNFSLAGGLPSDQLDRVLPLGELMSSRLLAAVLESQGVPATPLDGAAILRTNAVFGNATPNLPATRSRARARLDPLLKVGSLPIVAGYTGSTMEGRRTTLGRGGSDLTATVLGAVLPASEVQIWTDVDGVMSADPRLVPNARSLQKVSYEEMEALAAYGAKVLHPAATRPLREIGRPLSVKNTFRPEHPGTTILPERAHPEGRVRAVSTVPAVSLLKLEVGQSDRDLAFWNGIERRRTAVGLRPLLWHQRRGRGVELVIHREEAGAWSDLLAPPIAARNGRERRDDVSLVTAVGGVIGSDLGLKNEILARLLPIANEVHALPSRAEDPHLSFLLPDGRHRQAIRFLHDWLLAGDRDGAAARAGPVRGNSKEVA